MCMAASDFMGFSGETALRNQNDSSDSRALIPGDKLFTGSQFFKKRVYKTAFKIQKQYISFKEEINDNNKITL